MIASQDKTSTFLLINKQKLFHSVFLFALGFLLYSNSLQNGYVLDDSLFITGNKFTLKGIEGIKEIWTNDAFVGAHGRAFDLEGGRYRPLSITLFAVQYELFGLNPFAGHLVNVIFYALSCVLFYLFLSKLFWGWNSWLPLFAAILFTVHPIHTEVVANIKSLDEILAFFFLLLSLYCVIPIPRQNPYKEKEGGQSHLFSLSLGRAFLAFLFYFLSLLSKENTITALAVVPLLLWLFRPVTGTSKKIIPTLSVSGIFAAAAVLYLFLRTTFAGGFGERAAANIMDSPYLFASFLEKYATIIYVCGKYLWMLFLPYPLSFDYSFNAIPLRNFSDVGVILSALAYLAMFTYSIKIIFEHFRSIRKITPSKYELNTNLRSTKEKTSPETPAQPNNPVIIIAFGFLFYLFSFSIVSNFFFNIGAPMGERFAYLPSAGFCIALAGILMYLLKLTPAIEKFTYKLKYILPLAIIIPIASYATLQRNKAWKDNFTLYKTDIKTVPNSARAQLFYGIELLNRFYKTKNKAELGEAIKAMETACKINPHFYHAFYNLGLAYQANEDHVNAVKAFERVLQIEPKHINSHYYLGMSYGKGFNRFDKAIEFIEKGLKYGYNGADGYVNLGISYAMKGEYPNAIKSFEKGISITPGNANLYLNIGITYDNMGEKEKAKSMYEKAFAMDPALKR